MKTFLLFLSHIPQPIGAIVAGTVLFAAAAPAVRAQVLFQQFTYPTDTPPTGTSWWHYASGQLPALAKLGVWGVWHPVPVKGGSGAQSMGYDPYDLYDLGSKNQKGTTPTRFGTKADYLAFVAVAHANGLRVISDVVLNHAGGADRLEENPLMARLGMNDVPDLAKVPTRYLPVHFSFAAPHHLGWTQYAPVGADGRPGTGRFVRDLRHFHPSQFHPDRSEPFHKNEFGEDYCFEAENGYVARNMENWAGWFRAQTGVDGFRMDAVKLIDTPFLDGFARRARAAGLAQAGPHKTSFWMVGEYWDTNPTLLGDFQNQTHHQMKLFDFGLFYALWDMTQKPGAFDMHDLLVRRLADRNRAVMFVSNHDVDRFQPIDRQKRALPYAVTLAMDGQPSLFVRDYFGAEDAGLPKQLETLVALHNRFSVGRETVRFVDKSALVLEREKNLLACFNSGGANNDARTITIPTAWGPNVALRVAAASDGAVNPAATPFVTDASGSITVTIPANGFVWLVRKNANDKTNPDRFALKPLPTTQTTEFANDLDTGELSATPQFVTILLASGSSFTATVLDTSSASRVQVDLIAPSGRIVRSTQSKRGTKTGLSVARVPETGTYRVGVSASVDNGAGTSPGKLQLTYSAPAR